MATEYVVVQNQENNIFVSTQYGDIANSSIVVDSKPENLSVVTSSIVTNPPTIQINAGNGINVTETSEYTYSISLDQYSSVLAQQSLNSNGRLSLQSNNPTYTEDISSSTIYYTPYNGNQISLYNISTGNWDSYVLNEISLVLSGTNSNTNYDIFLYYNGTNLVLENIEWSSNTSRNTSIVYLDGILVKDGSYDQRYVGTIRTTAANTTEDSQNKRFIFSADNQFYKVITATDNTTHTYSNSTIRPYRNITTSGLTFGEFVCGVSYQFLDIVCGSSFATETSSSSVGVSIDNSLVFNTNATNTTSVSSGPALILTSNSIDKINVSNGYHYIQLVQSGSNITTFYNAFFKAILLC